jgi:hypothetical protein
LRETPRRPRGRRDVVAYLGALGGPRHAQTVATLRGIMERG